MMEVAILMVAITMMVGRQFLRIWIKRILASVAPRERVAMI